MMRASNESTYGIPEHWRISDVASAIDSELRDIRFILQALRDAGSEVAPLSTRLPGVTDNRWRNAKNLQRFKRSLIELQALRVWLHSEWVRLRGEPLFYGGFARLHANGIVAAPSRPVRASRGRPRGSSRDDAREWWVRLIQSAASAQRKTITQRDAIRSAEIIMNQRYGIATTSTVRGAPASESNYYRSRRRKKP